MLFLGQQNNKITFLSLKTISTIDLRIKTASAVDLPERNPHCASLSISLL